MKDELGDRMKSYYENRTRAYLPRRTNTIIRIDGKAFHTYTRGLKRPFDQDLIDDMDATTKYVCENIQGAKLGYVQSDEISILLTDYDKLTSDAWFDGNIQKVVSIAASLATSKFNQLRLLRQYQNGGIDGRSIKEFKLAQFDARVLTIPHFEEVINYFIWRQQDASRNSVQAVAQSLYSHKELFGSTVESMQEMIFQKGQNWNDYPVGQKRGRTVVRKNVVVPTTKEIYVKARDKDNFVWEEGVGYGIKRSQWVIEEPPIFSKEKEYIWETMAKKGRINLLFFRLLSQHILFFLRYLCQLLKQTFVHLCSPHFSLLLLQSDTQHS